MGVFEDYQVARWKVGTFDLAFPVMSINESGGNRIVRRERPFRDGAKLDDTGSKPRVWRYQIIFENTIEEPGIADINGGRPLYPEILNELIFSFDVHETGSLFLPTIGEQRARIETYGRVEQFDTRDTAMLDVTWVEDNEDSVDFRIVSGVPNVDTNGRRVGSQITFDGNGIAVDSPAFTEIDQAMQELENLANSPEAVERDIEQQNQIVAESSAKVVETFSMPHIPGRSVMTSTRSSKTQRDLELAKDMAARATNDARRGRPVIISVRLLADSSIAGVSALLQQDYSNLLAINPRVENPLFIPKGSVIKVFEDAQTQ